MSRIIDKAVIFLFLAVIFTGCKNSFFYKKTDLSEQNKSIVEQKSQIEPKEQKIQTEQQEGSLLKNAEVNVAIDNKKQDSVAQDSTESLEQVVTSESVPEINKVTSHDPVDIVDGLLQSASSGISIAVVAPLTGKYSSIGNMAFESALLKINNSKYNNAGSVKFYDISNLSSNNWQKNEEVQRLVNDDNDVIIGLFSADVTKKLLSLIPDKMFISFINDSKLAKDYPNLTVLSIDERFKIKSLFKYLEDTRRLFLSLILPATKKGYASEKLFRDLAKDSNVIIINSQFYQEKSRVSILASTRNIRKSLMATFFVRDGKFVTETYKDNLEKKKKQIIDEETEKVTVTTNAIYIDSNELDLITILDGLGKFNILNKNIQLFSSAILMPENSDATKLDNICYIGYNYNYVSDFNKTFSFHYKHLPNDVAYLMYDTISVLHYLANEEKMLPRKLYEKNGYKGIFDEFKFTRNGNVERRFSVYKLRNKNMFSIFVPSDYLSLETIDDKSNYINN